MTTPPPSAAAQRERDNSIGHIAAVEMLARTASEQNVIAHVVSARPPSHPRQRPAQLPPGAKSPHDV